MGDEGMAVTGALVGIQTPSAAAELVARRRDDGHEARTDVKLDGDRFRGYMPFPSLPWRDPAEAEFWDLYVALDSGEELRVGRHLDDVKNKRRAFTFELRELQLTAGERRFRPFYDAGNHVFIRTGRPARGRPGHARRPSSRCSATGAPSCPRTRSRSTGSSRRWPAWS